MPTQKLTYRVVIVGPSDVSKEVEGAIQEIRKLNDMDKSNQIGFDVYHWSIDGYANFHPLGPRDY